MNPGAFDGQAFYASLDSQRQARRITWKQVAKESGVSASTLTRISQGRRPDVDSMAALLAWSGLNGDSFVRRNKRAPREPESLAQITVLLRADRNLTPEGIVALEALVKSAYEKLRGD
jgi:transcriptional regulator with XRE-family HTH domain